MNTSKKSSKTAVKGVTSHKKKAPQATKNKKEKKSSLKKTTKKQVLIAKEDPPIEKIQLNSSAIKTLSKKDILIDAGLVIFGILLPLLAQGVLYFLKSSTQPKGLFIDPLKTFTISVDFYFQTIVQSLVWLAPVFYVIYIRKENLRNYGFVTVGIKNFLFALAHGLKTLLLSFLATGIFFIIYMKVMNMDMTELEKITSTDLKANINITAAVFTIIPFVFVSLAEELIFRSYLYLKLKEIIKNDKILIVGLSLLFATGHFYQGLVGFVATFFLGLAFALNFRKYQNIWVIMILHTAKNYAAILARI